MMFGWYEMDLALGRVRDIPPLQGVGFYVAVFPGRCPGLSHCAPLGRKTGAPFGGGRPVLLWGRRPLPRWGRLMLSVRRTIILRGCAARLICVCFIAGIPFGVLRFAVSRRYRRSESFFDVFWSFGVDRKRISSDRIGFNNPR